MEIEYGKISLLILEEIKGLRKDSRENALQLRIQLSNLFYKGNAEFDPSQKNSTDKNADCNTNLMITKVASLAQLSQPDNCEFHNELDSYAPNVLNKNNTSDNGSNSSLVLNPTTQKNHLETEELDGTSSGLVLHISDDFNQVDSSIQENSFTNIPIKQEPNDDFSNNLDIKPWPNIIENRFDNDGYIDGISSELDANIDRDITGQDLLSLDQVDPKPKSIYKRRVCTICHALVDADVFTEHMKSHTSEVKFTCQVCGKTFLSSIQLARHTLSHSDPKPFPCTICQKSFNTLSDLERHSELFHSIKVLNSLETSQYKDIMPLHSLREDSSSANHKVKTHQCPKCNKCYIKNSTLNKHIQRVHSQKPTLLKIVSLPGKLSGKVKSQCYICKKILSNRANLQRHLKNVHCNRSKKYANNGYLNKAKKPLVKNKFSCHLCNLTFALRYCLSQHMEKHHASQSIAIKKKKKKKTSKGNKVECPVCKKIVANSGNLKRHLKAIHFKEEFFRCTVCVESFLTKQQLLDHFLAEHKIITVSKASESETLSATPEKSVEVHNSMVASPPIIAFSRCTFCDDEFKDLHDLESHITSEHSNEYMCLECLFVFGKKELLLTHMQNIHQEAETYECDKCHIACSSQITIENHKVLHSKNDSVRNQNAFVCTICNISYSWKSALHRHNRKLHKKVLF